MSKLVDKEIKKNNNDIKDENDPIQDSDVVEDEPEKKNIVPETQDMVESSKSIEEKEDKQVLEIHKIEEEEPVVQEETLILEEEEPTPEEKKPVPEKEDFVIARRYSKALRFQHWGNLLLMLILMITGIEIFLGKFPLGGLEFTQNLHVWSGLTVFTLSFVIYTFIILKDRHVKEIIPMPRDFLDLAMILLCAVGILDDSRYPHYDRYNPETKEYVNQYHPTQKLLATGNYIMLFLIAMSGFALYKEILPTKWISLGYIGDFFMTPIINLGIPMRFFHFIIFAYFLGGVTIHFYFTVLPQNRGRLRGMALGREEIPLSYNHTHEMAKIEIKADQSEPS